MDESGFMLQPVVRRTWAPRGRTPIHYSWDRRDRLSTISALTVSPRRRRLGLYFTVLDHNVATDDFELFAAQLRYRMPHPFILVLDRWSVHRAAARRLARRFPRFIRLEWLPPYAPELNPVEQVWDRAKYVDLANYIPDGVGELGRSIRWSIRRTGRRQSLLRSFFEHARLKL